MLRPHTGREPLAGRTALLCFQTEAQARTLVGLAAGIGNALAASIELLYCRPPGYTPATSLEPWLDELTDRLRASCSRKTSVRSVGQDPEALLLDLRLHENATMFLATDTADQAATNWSYRLLRDAHSDAVLMHGAWPRQVHRVLLGAEAGRTQPAATGFASLIATATGADVFGVAAPSPQKRAMSTLWQLDQISGTMRSLADVRTYQGVVRGRSREAMLLAASKAQGPDVVIAGLHRGGLVGEFAAPRIPRRLIERCPAPVVLVNTPVRPALQRLAMAADRVFDVLPTLSVAQRAAIYAQVRRAARGDADFIFMIVASASLAALGLRLDSAVVIIGAMLVAPLMSPIVAVGLAVALGDGRLLTLASKSVLRGTVLALAAAAILGLVLPGGGVTGEMVKRANPSLLDLAVAIASGAAGAYALSRKGVSSSLPGVAIAVSLVPPLASTGIALAIHEHGVAAGSFLLFLVNLAAVATASGVMFVWMGFSPEADHVGRRGTFGKGAAGLGVMLIAVTVPLAWNALQPGESNVNLVVEETLQGAAGGLRSMGVVNIEAERKHGALSVTATIEAERPLQQPELAMLQARLSERLGEPVALTVRTELKARAD